MKQETLALYEGMYIISASLSDEARNKALEKVTKGITDRGGEVHKVHDMGRKRLAYEINKSREGYYYLLYFSVAPSSVKEMWQEYHLHEDLIRFITLEVDEVQESLEFKSLEQ